MNLSTIAAALCILAWIVLAFVLALPSGLVHAPLMVGVLLIVKAIVGGREKQSDLPVRE